MSVLLQTELRYLFGDLQGLLNDQFHVVSDLFTGIRLCLRTLSYNIIMFCYSSETHPARSGWVTILYSKDMSKISYLASSFAPVDLITRL